MEVIFIRHLPTPGNEKRQYIGRTDEPLSDRAVTIFRKQQEGSDAVLYPDIQCLTASPMERCVRTAELIWPGDRNSTRLNSSHDSASRMPSSA